ncbi:hypothetical protein AAZX31_15G213100 [Glycine max]
MINILYFKFSTYKTLSMETREGIQPLSIKMIFPLPMPRKATIPPSTSFRSRNIDLSPSCVMSSHYPSTNLNSGLFLPRISQLSHMCQPSSICWLAHRLNHYSFH